MKILLYMIIGLVAGTMAGILGIGGGLIIIPALTYMFGFTQHQAQGTTLAILVPPIGLLAAWRYYQSGHVNLTVVTFICIGFLFGGLWGANLAQNLSDLHLKRLFGMFLLLVSLNMILSK
ncbi:MAG: sulfite exporter TauE/SafE family protein [Candidatus Omnitrophica bacterium]|nr:sulfite exporter TauE/SafE family protein [Candidatus Omnitrophota bacterium]